MSTTEHLDAYRRIAEQFVMALEPDVAKRPEARWTPRLHPRGAAGCP